MQPLQLNLKLEKQIILTKDFEMKDHIPEYGSIAKAVQEARDNIGNLIDASRNEIIFTSGQPKVTILQY